MSGSNTLPIKITVNGMAEADAAFNALASSSARAQQQIRTAADNSTSSFGKFNQMLGQGGFQLQDFAVQVQGGTSALTALSQQGSQFLGIFGTGGAIAGAVLTVGILAYKLLEGKDAAELLNAALKGTDDYFERLDKSAKGLTASLESQANVLVQLRDKYALLDAAQREVERRDLDRQQRSLDEAAAGLRGQARTAAGSRALQFRDRSAEADRARELFGTPALGAPEDVQALARIQEGVKGLSGMDPSQIAEFGTALEQIAKGTGKAAQEAKAAMDALDKVVPQAREWVERQRRVELARTAISGESSLLDTLPPSEPKDGAPAVKRSSSGRADPADRADVEGVLEKLRQKQDDVAKDLASSLDPSIAAWEKYRDTIEKIQHATDLYRATVDQAGGPLGISPELAVRLNALAKDQYDASMKKIGDSGAAAGIKIESAFGRATSALENAIVAGGSFGDVLKGLETDVVRLITRLTIMQPLEKAGNSLLSSLGSSAGSWIASLFGPGASSAASPAVTAQPHAFGGVFGPDGPVPLHRYSSGGIATSPQLALFGEGRNPEAYVPLPDGRSIPVTMQGQAGGVVYSPTIQVDARGADAGAEARIYSNVAQMLAASQQKFVSDIQRGGGLSKAVGRR